MSVRLFAVGALVGAFLGCDSTVIPEDGAAGSPATGGQGGTPSLGGSPSNGGFGQGGLESGGATQIGGAGQGGAQTLTGCEQTCQNVEACFGASCAQAGIDCSDPQAQCFGDCLKDASCQELGAFAQGQPLPPNMQACLQGCQGGMGGAGQGGAGGGMQQGCGQCVFQNNCLAPCMNQPACQGWGQCVFQCDTPACYSDCNAQFPDAQPYYAQIYDCACSSCTGTACDGQMDPCNQGG